MRALRHSSVDSVFVGATCSRELRMAIRDYKLLLPSKAALASVGTQLIAQLKGEPT